LHAYVLTPQDGLWYRDDDSDGANDLMLDLGGLPGLDYSQAYDINAFGHAVGRAYDYYVEQSRAFLYRDGGMQDLGTLGGDKAYANGINDADQVVGKAQTAGGDWHPFLWEKGVMYDLYDLIHPGCGWEPLSAEDINNAGWIAGCGTAPCGERHAFLLIPPDVAPGDLDGDGDVDLGDFATFALCYHGANITIPPPGCDPTDFLHADLDDDADVDLSDFATFALNFTG
jgi:probable HAF family extracellular repeat protein